MKGYEYLARVLRAYGVDFLFYQEMMLINTLRKYKEIGGNPIMCHSELAAGYMADGYARISNKPAVVAAQSVGSANLAASLQDAWFGCSPVVALTGRQTPKNLYRNAYQESDHRLFFEGITKFNGYITAAEQFPMMMRQCFRQAVTGKPRPTHMDLYGFCALEFENEEISEEMWVEPRFAIYPPYRPKASEEEVAFAIQAINAAKKPVLIAGRGAVISGARMEIYEFSKKYDIPVSTTCDGKTIIDETDELWIGISGTYGMACANEVIQNADLVIFAGSQANNQATKEWTVPLPSTKVIQIDIEPYEIGRNYPNSISLLGDIKTVFEQLNKTGKVTKRSEWRNKVVNIVKPFTDAQREMMIADTYPITTGRLCGEISANLPEDAILVADTGWATVWSATMIRMKASQRYLRSAGTLGWGFPASIGVKLAQPGRTVVCYIGDGGLLYNLGELETAVRYNVPVVIVVNNNYSYSQCGVFMKECGAYKEAENEYKERLSFTNKFSLANIASEFGALGIKVTKCNEIGPAIKKALTSGRPALVEVVTDGDSPLSA